MTMGMAAPEAGYSIKRHDDTEKGMICAATDSGLDFEDPVKDGGGEGSRVVHRRILKTWLQFVPIPGDKGQVGMEPESVAIEILWKLENLLVVVGQFSVIFEKSDAHEGIKQFSHNNMQYDLVGQGADVLTDFGSHYCGITHWMRAAIPDTGLGIAEIYEPPQGLVFILSTSGLSH